ncbi:hypothetical protein QN277_025800 [Acacia crassicarpa]|uniref:Cullin family profile domain-containing protein n=1 Tax=Acacia crassicarpa TaxID=499986 RepID=A0AAE1MGP5_9FABA|nr:hypothetical protein QN277_025800 [Acacia crassicarpa]
MGKEIIKLEQGWKQLQEGITKLTNILEGLPNEKPFTSEEYVKQYTKIYNMCTQRQPYNYSKELYEKYRETIQEYINSTVLPSLRARYDEFLLRELVKRWSNHKVMTRWLSGFFHYLDHYYTTNGSVPNLNDVALTCFRDLVFKKESSRVTDTIISLIHKERDGEQIDQSLLKNAIHIYIEIGVYEEAFEVHMLGDTSSYYRRKAASWIEVDSCPSYMLKAEESLKRERNRAGEAGYLHRGTLRKLVERVQQELLVTHATQLLGKEDSGCGVLLRADNVEDLSRMYRLYHEIYEGLQLVANVFKKQVIGEGTTLVQQAEEACNSQAANKSSGQEQAIIVGKFIELHDRYMGYVKRFFMNNNVLRKALKEAFEVLCNKSVTGISSSELVSTFCDNILKKGGGSEKLSDEAIDEILEKVVYLLVYHRDKDLFAEFYRKRFSRRLLYDRSANEDHEKNFLGKLKHQFGANYTSKMEGMMADLAISKDYQRSFEEYLHENPLLKPGIDLSVSVLTIGFWPTCRSCSMKLPSEMVKCVEVFNEYYSSKTKQRKLSWVGRCLAFFKGRHHSSKTKPKKLSWVFSLGTCNIYGNFQEKTVELVVSTYQAATLLLFNNSERLSFSEIMTQLDLDHEDLVRILHSLSCAKYKILSKEPNTKTITQNDIFEFNSRFTDPMGKIKIPLPPIDDRRKVVEDVDKDRKYAIDAATMRIMKSRKVLGHQQLVLECIEMLSSRTFKPNPRVIKIRIDNLISQDYLERDPDDSNTYRYLP